MVNASVDQDFKDQTAIKVRSYLISHNSASLVIVTNETILKENWKNTLTIKNFTAAFKQNKEVATLF